MKLRILGGELKGRSVDVLDTDGLRPTSIQIRRKIFDSQQSYVRTIFIDCCAGTGVVGLEALSRGAEKVFFIEQDKKTFKQLEKNLENIFKNEKDHLLLKKRCILVHSNLLSWLNSLKAKKTLESFPCIFFLDPPYENHHLYQVILNLFVKKKLWGHLWIEGDIVKGLKLDFWEQLNLNKKIYTQGKKYFIKIFFSS